MPGSHDGDNDAPHRHTRSDDGYAPHEHTRGSGAGPAPLSESSVITVKFAILIGSMIVGFVGTNLRAEIARISMRYELEAQIVSVKTESDTKILKMEGTLAQIKATNCAIARSLHVVTVECGSFDP